jgi:hypothetical protein
MSDLLQCASWQLTTLSGGSIWPFYNLVPPRDQKWLSRIH